MRKASGCGHRTSRCAALSWRAVFRPAPLTLSPSPCSERGHTQRPVQRPAVATLGRTLCSSWHRVSQRRLSPLPEELRTSSSACGTGRGTAPVAREPQPSPAASRGGLAPEALAWPSSTPVSLLEVPYLTRLPPGHESGAVHLPGSATHGALMDSQGRCWARALRAAQQGPPPTVLGVPSSATSQCPQPLLRHGRGTVSDTVPAFWPHSGFWTRPGPGD